jgi:hypothetical protein
MENNNTENKIRIMKQRANIIYRTALVLLSLLMLMGSSMYFFNHEMVAATFLKLGFPTFIIYPLAIAKLSGVVVLWVSKSEALKQWAYAGFAFVFILATSAHSNINDGEFAAALMALIFVATANVFERKIKRSSVTDSTDTTSAGRSKTAQLSV